MPEWEHQFILELKFQVARKCLADALLVAREREYEGIALLVGSALSDLDLIGKLAGINGQKRIKGPNPS